MEGLAGLKTPFRPQGRVTAGNSSGLNDGATAALLASESAADELGQLLHALAAVQSSVRAMTAVQMKVTAACPAKAWPRQAAASQADRFGGKNTHSRLADLSALINPPASPGRGLPTWVRSIALGHRERSIRSCGGPPWRSISTRRVSISRHTALSRDAAGH